jgi:DHA3 family macrolide efflux protein-like MFS transporter
MALGSTRSQGSGVASVLRLPSFMAFAVAQTVSLFGDKLDQIALIGLISLVAHASPIGLSKLAFFTTLPVLIFGPVSGVFVDRWDRKRTMVICDSCRTVLVLLIPVVYWTQAGMYGVFGIVFLVFLFGLFFNSSRMSIIPNLVPHESLLAANTVSKALGMIATVVGFWWGGYIVDWKGWSRYGLQGWEAGFYLDSITYLISAIVLASITLRVAQVVRAPRHESPGSGFAKFTAAFRRLFTDLSEAFRLIVNDRLILLVMGSVILLCVVAGSVFVLAVYIISVEMGKGTAGVGTTAAVLGVGMGLGSLTIHVLATRVRKEMVILFSFTLIGALMLLFSFVQSFMIGCFLTALAGMALVSIMISQDTLLHEVVPEEVRGRVFSAREWTLSAIFMVSSALAGLGAKLFSTRSTLAGVGVVVIVVSLWGQTLQRRHR